jgi:hypothetical protein
MVLAKSRKRGINIAYTTQYFRAVDVRIRTVTDMVAIPQLNSKETKCQLTIYANPSMSRLEKFRFLTHPIWDLYDTNEEVEELDMDIKDVVTKTRREQKIEDSVQDVFRNSSIKKKPKEKPVSFEEDL